MNEVELLQAIHETLLAVEHHLAALVSQGTQGFPHDHFVIHGRTQEIKELVRNVVRPKDQT